MTNWEDELNDLSSASLNDSDEKIEQIALKCQLRKCQVHAFLSVKDFIARRKVIGANISREFIIQMATGTGKTGVITLVSSCIPEVKNVLVLTHSVGIRSQLFDSIYEDSDISFWKKVKISTPTFQVQEIANDKIPGKFKAGTRNIVIASIQSLSHQVSSLIKNTYDLVIFDEGHKKGAEKWDAVVDQMNCPVMLVTATPFRSDGRTLFDKPIYKYTLNDALQAESPILKKVKFKTQNKNNVVDQLVEELKEKQKLYDTKKSKPKIIFRASSYEDCINFHNDFKSKAKNLKIIVLHTGCKKNQFPFYKTKNLIDKDYDIIIHQDILIEGFDDPSLTILGMQNSIEDGRVFVQQIGRIIRHDSKQRGIDQEAVVIAPDKDMHEKNWLMYNKFEQDSSAYVFKKHSFIPISGSLSNEFLDSIYLRPSVLVRKFDREPSDKKIDTLHEEVLDWFRYTAREATKLADKFSKPRKLNNLKYSIYLYQKENPPNFLFNPGISNNKWHLLILVFVGRYLFIQSSDGSLPKPISTLPHVGYDDFDKLLPQRGSNITNIRLENTATGKDTLKSKSLSSSKVESHILVSRDGTFSPMKLSWNTKVDGGKIESATLSSKRFSNQQKVDLKNFLQVCRNIKLKLDKKSKPKLHNVFLNMAKECVPSNSDPFYLSITLDKYYAIKKKGKRTTTDIMFFEGLKNNARFILKSPDSLSVEFSVTLGFANGHYFLEYAANSDQFEIEFEDETKDLLEYLNQKRNFVILFKDGVCYFTGRFIKTREIASSDIVKYLKNDTDYPFSKCKIELGGGKNDKSFPANSIFYHVEENLRTTDRYILICDDDSGEWADFIYFNFDKKIIRLIHCKHDGSVGVRAKSLYEVLGQASKTAHHVLTIPDNERIIRWNGFHSKRKNIKRIRNSVTLSESEIADLYSDPVTRREVWVIQPSLSISGLKKQIKSSKENFQLISMAINACISNNADFSIFGSP